MDAKLSCPHECLCYERTLLVTSAIAVRENQTGTTQRRMALSLHVASGSTVCHGSHGWHGVKQWSLFTARWTGEKRQDQKPSQAITFVGHLKRLRSPREVPCPKAFITGFTSWSPNVQIQEHVEGVLHSDRNRRLRRAPGALLARAILLLRLYSSYSSS